MSEPFIGEIRIFSFVFAPRGWAMCNGQLLPINQNQALFSLLGTTYGGNGQVTFALPNLQGRAPIHFNGNHPQGESSGEATHTLAVSELPLHSHALRCTTASAETNEPAGALPAFAAEDLYSRTGSAVSMSPAVVGNAGGSQPHNNMQPYLVLNFCIAIQGIWPSPI